MNFLHATYKKVTRMLAMWCLGLETWCIEG